MASVNLALNKTTAASGYVSPYAPAKAVDGSLVQISRWLCNTVPAWMSVDFGMACWINRWVVRGMPTATPTGWQSPDYNMSDFKLQVSDNNINWNDVDAVIGNSLSVCDRTFPAIFCRYVRLYVTKGLRTNSQYASLMELEVYSAPSAYLAGLTVSSGALTPAFSSGHSEYTAPKVGFSTSTITVTPIAEDPQASIKVNGVAAISGQPATVNLNVGSNIIPVAVTGAAGSPTITYNVTVVRAAAYMSSLVLKAPDGTVIPLNTTFDKDNQSYTASVKNDITSVNVIATASESTANVIVNGQSVPSGQAVSVNNLVVGPNTIITSVAGDTKAYTVTLTRASSPYLTSVNVTYVNRTPVIVPVAINKNQTQYEVDIPNTVNSVTITAFGEDTSVKILVNGNQNLASGQTSSSISVSPTSQTSIPIITTSSTGTDSISYVIVIK